MHHMGTYRDIIARFPRGGLSYVFAYGSGVKPQVGCETIERQKNNVIDLIFCVRDPLGWHAENISRHPSHYSALQLFGPRFLMHYQERLGAGVYFNTLIPLHDMDLTIKYGVVSREQLVEDLLEWKHLYLAGRLHKPVHNIVPPTDDNELTEAITTNLLHAFQVALLLLPESFTAFELFQTIASLSYKGDFRMIFGENKKKVYNIVSAQQKDFLDLYYPAMQKLTKYVAVDFCAKALGSNERSLVRFEQDKSQAASEYHLRQLPVKLRKRLVRNAAFRGSYSDIVGQLACTDNLHEVLQASVNDIVWRSSIVQSLKNIPSAGAIKSFVYMYRKAMKTFA